MPHDDCTTSTILLRLQGLRGAVKELLGEFYKKNKRLPEVLIMYRDGVSEGQFDEVRPAKIATSTSRTCSTPASAVLLCRGGSLHW